MNSYQPFERASTITNFGFYGARAFNISLNLGRSRKLYEKSTHISPIGLQFKNFITEIWCLEIKDKATEIREKQYTLSIDLVN